MKQARYILTGISRLTGAREQISRPMAEEEARALLENKKRTRRHRAHTAYTRLRAERMQPIQLTLKFKDYED